MSAPRPVARAEVFDAYWRLAAERQEIFFRRLAGQPAPWTTDPILREYKFCNAYRASDRVSQYLIRDVIYRPAPVSAADELFRIVLFRLFSNIATWVELEHAVGQVRIDALDELAAVLDARSVRGDRLYTGAFILCANRAYGHARKHHNHLALLRDMFQSGQLPADVARCRSLRELVEVLRRWPLIGDFMSYQIATDINYGTTVDFDEDTFTVAGPGAERGIAKCFSDRAGWRSSRVISWMVDRQEDEFARLGLEFRSLWGRRLKAIDCQNLFCEVDKYSRVAFPYLTSARSRIKARHQPAGPLPPPFYPPKWELPLEAPADAQLALTVS